MKGYTWFKAAMIRALKTVCQTAVALIPAGALIQDVNWEVVGGTALLAGLCSIFTSIITTLPEVSIDPSTDCLIEDDTCEEEENDG